MIVAEGLEWTRLYWVRGVVPKHVLVRNSVKDPPCSGWSTAFVLTGEKRSTIFCPYSFHAYSVPNDCLEIQSMKEPTRFSLEFVGDMMKSKWAQFQGWGWQRDYDTCTLVLKRLGLPVPAQVMMGGEEDTRKKGGKAVGSRLLKPVTETSKRGKFLQWFLDGESSRSIREAMAEFSMTRSNALSYLYMLQKDHGIGYELVGDMATISLPGDCTDPFRETQLQAAKTDDCEIPDAKVEGDEDDDSWLD